MDRDRGAPGDDGPIFYQDQLRERLEQYQVMSLSPYDSISSSFSYSDFKLK